MRKITALLIITVISGLCLINYLQFDHQAPSKTDIIRARKAARAERLHRMLKDPATGKVPLNVRSKELAFSKDLAEKHVQSRIENTVSFNWSELGPSNVAGRIRSIALDSRNSNIVLAGAASGGIWRSSDGGTSWASVLPQGSNLAISSITQDVANADTWYAATGEIDGGSVFTRQESFVGTYGGSGIYKSSDNGQTWTHQTYVVNGNGYTVASTASTDIQRNGTSPFVFTSKILSANVNGTATLFLASQSWGLWSSTDNGQNFSRFGLSLTSQPEFTDIVVDSNGIISIYSGPTATETDSFGFFRSSDGGATFKDVTPSTFSAATNARSVLALAPSSQKVMYAFTHLGNDDSSLLKFDFTNLDSGTATEGTVSDQSSFLPEYPRSIFGSASTKFTTQNGYDMTIAIHPTNPDFVLLGYVELIRSTDGFASSLTSDPGSTWIGGNDNPTLKEETPAIVFSQDFKHHADQHVVLFDPNNPNTVWSGHDGGLSKTTDITASRVAWTSMNNNVNVTQFYHISVRGTDLIGGTQDNGTPHLNFANFSGALVPSQQDLSSGDGSFSFYGGQFRYVSSQNGNVVVYDANGFLTEYSRSDLSPRFIHPFAVDPNIETNLYFPAGDSRGTVARNNNASTNTDWTDLSLNNGLLITAIKVSTASPQSRLYVGGYDTQDGNIAKLMVLDNASTAAAENFVTRTITGIPASAWLNDIGINPADGNEILLAFSNYNIDGIAHSSDGGSTFSIVEGNLGAKDGSADNGITGPSIRSAEIVQLSDGSKKYIVGTSIGVFSTTTLNGASTVWTSELTQLDNVIIEDLDQRADDHAIAVGTHGRGAFIGQINSNPQLPNLTVSSFTATNEDGGTEIKVGQKVKLNVTISNSGTVPVSSAFNVAFKKGDADAGSQSFSETIQASGTGTLSFTLTDAETAAGTVSFTVTLDSDGSIAESNETDNTGSVSIEVIQPLPNLKVKSFSASAPDSDLIEIGKAFDFLIEIENAGEAATEGSFMVSFSGTDYSVSGTIADAIAAGTSSSFTLSGDPFQAVGDVEITATVDSDNAITESDETDNTLSSTISVSEVVLSASTQPNGITVYPNPVIDQLFIESASTNIGDIFKSLEVFDILGKKINARKEIMNEGIAVDLLSAENGTYILKYQIKGKRISSTILVRH